jgi:dienelactone hydrolase
MPFCRLIAACAVASLSLPLAAQTLTVRPGPEVVAGEPLHLAVEGARPGARLTLRASRSIAAEGGARAFQSQAVFVADAAGRVDVDTQAPVEGSYRHADARGLFWSMAPVASGAAPDASRAGEVVLQLLDGDRPLAERRVRLLPQAADVVVTEPAEFPGARFATSGGAARRPALIVLGGSEGGSLAARTSAPLLASQGYAVLGLPYYSPPGWSPQGPTPPELPALPGSFVDIELARLAQARDWLARQPGVDASRIGVYGVSKGAEFALAAASRMPWIKAVAAIVPSDVIWEGWGNQAPEADKRSSFAWQGQALPWVPYEGFAEEFAGAAQGKPIRIRRPLDKGRAAHPERVAAARIEVEKIAVPVFLVGGGDDQVWDSAGMARAIAVRRAEAGLTTVALVYPQAGHALSGHGWSPTTTYNEGLMKFGGQPEADARAQGEAWPRLLAFLRESLGR